jgi:hypothetical protein
MRSPRKQPSRSADNPDNDRIDPFSDLPEPFDDADEDSELDDFDLPCTDADDARWDVFVADDDERDPQPGPGEFWNDEFPNDE